MYVPSTAPQPQHSYDSTADTKRTTLKICLTSPASSGNTSLKCSSIQVLVAWGVSLCGNKGIYDYQYYSVGSHILTSGTWCHYWKGLHLTNWTTHAYTMQYCYTWRVVKCCRLVKLVQLSAGKCCL